MTRLVGAIGSLAHEVSATPAETHGDLLHLRLVLQPLELAALPFELASSTRGLPGEGTALLLQNARPVVLTRETHRVAPPKTRWPSEPRVLFAWASPDGLPPVPWRAHLLALTQALRPWIGSDDDTRDHLRLLPDASIEELRYLCHGRQFTHVHLLLHGVEMEGGSALERRYGLAFSDGHGGRRAVDGQTLAAALTRGGSDAQRPAVVTVAGCDSGQVGSVLGGGASLAHQLHADGIPLVVASQFPLSFRASLAMVDVLYQGLLRGEDPRDALHKLRRHLEVEGEHPWEWASLVAYAALPDDLATQLERVRFERHCAAIDVRLELHAKGPLPKADRDVIDARVADLEALLTAGNAEAHTRIHDYLGSVALRWIDGLIAQNVDDSGSKSEPSAKPSNAPLTSLGVTAAAHRAQHHFREVLARSPGDFWAANVANELELFLGGRYDRATHDAVRWHVEHTARCLDPARRTFADITELALHLTELLLADRGGDRARQHEHREAAMAVYERIVREAGAASYAAFRAQRTVKRFKAWSTWMKRPQVTVTSPAGAPTRDTSPLETNVLHAASPAPRAAAIRSPEEGIGPEDLEVRAADEPQPSALDTLTKQLTERGTRMGVAERWPRSPRY